MSNPNTTNPPSGRLSYKIPEAATLLGISESSIRRAIESGQLKACRRMRHILIPRAELEKFVEVSK
jgi:excisionase family DNA binding protein